MKKTFSLIIILIVIFSLTGCGTREITCTIEDGTQSIINRATFKGSELIKGIMETTIQVDSDQIDETYSFLQSSVAEIEEQTGLKYSISKGSNSITLRIEMEPSKMSEEFLESLSGTIGDLKNISVNKYIENMESQGYTCK